MNRTLNVGLLDRIGIGDWSVHAFATMIIFPLQTVLTFEIWPS